MIAAFDYKKETISIYFLQPIFAAVLLFRAMIDPLPINLPYLAKTHVFYDVSKLGAEFFSAFVFVF